jgi:hypothetical protein
MACSCDHSFLPGEKMRPKQCRAQAVPGHGLRHEIVHAGFETGKCILSGRVGGQGSDVYRKRMDGA